jgi:hypothetical protein
MTTPDRRADAESRLRRSFASLGGARALLVMQPPSCDDAVNRASAAALHAARALVDSQWAKDSQPGWDPTFRPGMVTRLGGLVAERKLSSLDAFLKLLDRFEALAANMSLPPDFTLYLRTLVEDGLDADTGEAPGYDLDEASLALETATQLISSVAHQIGLGDEFRVASQSWVALPKIEKRQDNGPTIIAASHSQAQANGDAARSS